MPSTSLARPMTFSSTQLQALRARVNGRVFVPGDDGYDTARQTWNVTTFDQRPAIVVMPSIAADVASAVSFAREHNLSIAVQGGGHGHPHPANDALLVNFASMTSVQVMPVAAASGFVGPIGCGRHGTSGSRREVARCHRRRASARTRAAQRLCRDGWGLRLHARRRHRMAGAPVRRGRRQPSIRGTGDRRRSTAAGQRPEPRRSVLGTSRRWRQLRHRHLIRIRSVSGEGDLRRIRRLSACARQAGVERLRAMDEDRARHADVRRASRALSAGARSSRNRCAARPRSSSWPATTGARRKERRW